MKITFDNAADGKLAAANLIYEDRTGYTNIKIVSRHIGSPDVYEESFKVRVSGKYKGEDFGRHSFEISHNSSADYAVIECLRSFHEGDRILQTIQEMIFHAEMEKVS